jgi:hypothetical protein
MPGTALVESKAPQRFSGGGSALVAKDEEAAEVLARCGGDATCSPGAEEEEEQE